MKCLHFFIKYTRAGKAMRALADDRDAAALMGIRTNRVISTTFLVGSALAGSAERMENALRLRKMLGGGMRQVGVLAAAARYGLEHHRDRLAEDHDAASRLGRALQGLSGVTVAPVETNIVVAEVADAERVVGAAKAQGVAFSAISPRAVRMVTHLDVSGATFDKAIERVVAGFREAGHV